MDIGLYLLKYPFRKMIQFLVPLFKNVNPNLISLALIPIGILSAWVYFIAIKNNMPVLFLVGIVLSFLRMIVATLDGLVAQEFQKSTVLGDVVNRVTPELCDLMLLPTIIWASGNDKIGLIALTFAWATPFFGLLGAPSGVPVQSVGPVGQTDRLAALMLFSFLEYFSKTFQWNISFIDLFLNWLICGGIMTLGLRFYRVVREARLKDQENKANK